ncbi:MAG TPA: glycosyltransferase family protein [Spirochaetota bacterium]|nr:glycosyltransferase family protein [Spirochaetota bacterium]HPJ35554.1 glycosyltransferase family protein [Spirochaetota bacterium]
MKAAAVIQARLNSTRLRSKALLPLCGIPMIQHVIERAKLISGTSVVILATGTGIDNDPLEDIAGNCGITIFRGPENDVLERYYRAAENIQCDYVIRITGDNPLTDHIAASRALTYAREKGADHCTTSGIPLGTGVEVIRKTALEKAFREGIEPHHREHVTPYIKEHPELFRIEKYSSRMDNPFPDLRLTVDTEEDFKLMTEIYNRLYRGKPIEPEEVIDLIRREPELRLINSGVEQRPMTHHSNGKK